MNLSKINDLINQALISILLAFIFVVTLNLIIPNFDVWDVQVETLILAGLIFIRMVITNAKDKESLQRG